MNGERIRIFKEAVLTNMNILSQHSPGETRGHHKQIYQDSNTGKLRTGYLSNTNLERYISLIIF
jgi:hypothetical protein